MRVKVTVEIMPEGVDIDKETKILTMTHPKKIEFTQLDVALSSVEALPDQVEHFVRESTDMLAEQIKKLQLAESEE